jgi:hypothetical protein
MSILFLFFLPQFPIVRAPGSEGVDWAAEGEGGYEKFERSRSDNGLGAVGRGEEGVVASDMDTDGILVSRFGERRDEPAAGGVDFLSWSRLFLGGSGLDFF